MNLDQALDKAIAQESADPQGLPAEGLAALFATPPRRTYRVITVAEAPWGAFPSYRDGGPSKVTATDWGTSQSSLDRLFSSPSVAAADDGLVTLNVYRSTSAPGEPYVSEKHALDGTKYPSGPAADQAAYEAGLIGYMVYDDSQWADLVPASA